MLIEVLIALALFGLSAVFLVDGAFVAARTIRVMKDTREMEQDLLWVRGQIFQEPDYEKIEEGGGDSISFDGRGQMGDGN